MKKLAIGLLVDKLAVNTYIEDFIEWGKKQENISIDYLILQKKDRVNKDKLEKIINIIKEKGISSLIQRILFKVLNYFEKKIILSKYPHHKNHYSEYNIEHKIKHKIEISPEVSKKGNILKYSEEDINKIKSLNLDVILRFNSGILKGEILNCSKFGILSFHHGDNRIYRGLPAGFWEVYKKSSSTGFIIQQLTDSLDGGNVIFRGNIITKAFYALNQSNLYQYSYYYLKKILTELSINNKLPNFEEKKPYYNALYKEPSIKQIIFYIFSLIKKKISNFFLFKVLNKKYIWNVAFYPDNWKNLSMWKAKKIDNPPGTFLADPFLVKFDNKNYTFVEEYDFKKKKGLISVYLINSFTYERVGVALQESFHLSFPYIFQYEGKHYLLPETSKNDDIRIYECINFPLEWKLKKILMKEVNSLDNMVFKYDNLWWLFCNLCIFDKDKSSSELSIYYSENGPLTDKWIPHKKNPLITNSNISRNAGLIFDKKDVFRVSQSSNFMDYGNKFQINKIIDLSLDNYTEEPFHKISPLFKKNISGTHHISSNNEFTIFDYSELK
jgi:hypothetical protein